MRYTISPILWAVAVLALLMTGCTGTKTMPEAARAGDTVALYAGWKHHFDRDKITITFTGSDGSKTVYQPGNSHVRAIIDKYPDPLSYIVVGTRVGLNDGFHSASTYGSEINTQNTSNDPDWWETTIYVDTPTTLPTGTADVQVDAADGESYGPIPLTVLPGTGSPATFGTDGISSGLSANMLESMERMPHYTIKFSGGSAVPAALEVWLSHDPDQTAGGAPGKAFAVNPRGEMKNLSWSDSGTNMHVLLLPSGDGTWEDPYFPDSYGLKYWKFYVTGGITNVQVTKVAAYDKSGTPISGVSATVSQ